MSTSQRKHERATERGTEGRDNDSKGLPLLLPDSSLPSLQ